MHVSFHGREKVEGGGYVRKRTESQELPRAADPTRATLQPEEEEEEKPEEDTGPAIIVPGETIDTEEIIESNKEKAKEKAAQESRFIRVDSSRLGHLINLVGELVINSAAMKVMAESCVPKMLNPAAHHGMRCPPRKKSLVVFSRREK